MRTSGGQATTLSNSLLTGIDFSGVQINTSRNTFSNLHVGANGSRAGMQSNANTFTNIQRNLLVTTNLANGCGINCQGVANQNSFQLVSTGFSTAG